MPQAASIVHTDPQWYCLQSHICPPPPEAPRKGWTAAMLGGGCPMQWRKIVSFHFRLLTMHIQTLQKLHLLTRDGVSKLLPVTPDITCPHSRETSDARVRGARQDKGSLPSYHPKSSRIGNQNPRNENSLQKKTQKPKNNNIHIFSGVTLGPSK